MFLAVGALFGVAAAAAALSAEEDARREQYAAWQQHVAFEQHRAWREEIDRRKRQSHADRQRRYVDRRFGSGRVRVVVVRDRRRRRG